MRGRNALVARAEFGELYVDYYLHQGQHGYQHEPRHDEMLKEALSAVSVPANAGPACVACKTYPEPAAESERPSPLLHVARPSSLSSVSVPPSSAPDELDERDRLMRRSSVVTVLSNSSWIATIGVSVKPTLVLVGWARKPR